MTAVLFPYWAVSLVAGCLRGREKACGKSDSELRLEEEEEGERQTEQVEHTLGVTVGKAVGGGDKEGERE